MVDEILLLSFNFESKYAINRVIICAIGNEVIWQKLKMIEKKTNNGKITFSAQERDILQ